MGERGGGQQGEREEGVRRRKEVEGEEAGKGDGLSGRGVGRKERREKSD